MRNKLSKFFCPGILIFIFTIAANAQVPTNPLPEMQNLYKNLEFEGVIKVGRQFLRSNRSVPPSRLTDITELMALSFYQLGEIDSARAYFLSLLSIDPQHKLDPIQTSPKIIQFFNQLKENYQQSGEKPQIVTYRKYIFIKDPRPGAAWRSIILPGWGQFFKGQKKKAWIVGGVFTTLLVTSTISWIQENRFHDKYLSARQPTEIEKRYKTYNNWYKIRRVSTLLTVSSWIYAFVDALWSPVVLPEARLQKNGAILYSLQIHF